MEKHADKEQPMNLKQAECRTSIKTNLANALISCGMLGPRSAYDYTEQEYIVLALTFILQKLTGADL